MATSIVGDGRGAQPRAITIEQIAKIHSNLDAMLDDTLGEIEEFGSVCSIHNGGTRRAFESGSESFLSRVKQAKEVIARPAVQTDDNFGNNTNNSSDKANAGRRGLSCYDIHDNSILDGSQVTHPHAEQDTMAASFGGGVPRSGNPLSPAGRRAPLVSFRSNELQKQRLDPDVLNATLMMGRSGAGGGGIGVSSPANSFLPGIGNLEQSLGSMGTMTLSPTISPGSAGLAKSQSSMFASPTHHSTLGKTHSSSVIPLGEHRHSHYIKRLEKVQTDYQEQQIEFDKVEREGQGKMDNGVYGLYFPHKVDTWSKKVPPPKKKPPKKKGGKSKIKKEEPAEKEVRVVG